jgi:hypothetical protein
LNWSSWPCVSADIPSTWIFIGSGL